MNARPFDPTILPAGLRDLDLEPLAATFGTPLFVYDEQNLRARARDYVQQFGAGNVAYAGKAFLCGAMVRLVEDEGLHLDVATGGELSVALGAGFPPERLVFHGNNKSDDELTAARDAGVGRVVADSFDELDRLERIGCAGDVLVRVTPGVEAHTHEFIETGTDTSKFGFTVSTGAPTMPSLVSSRPQRCASAGSTLTSAPRSSASTRTRRRPRWSADSRTTASARPVRRSPS